MKMRGLEQLGGLAAAAFQRAESAFHEHAADKICRRILLGGCAIELQFATRDLERLFMTPLEHLVTERHPADASIAVWEDPKPASQLLGNPGVYRHAVPPAAAPTNMGDLPALCNARHHSVWFDWQGWLQFYDRQQRRVLVQLACARDLPAWEFAAPLRSPISMLLMERGMTIAHAAAVGWEGRGVLLAGDGGAGKSSTALKCLVSGSQFLGDDYCVLQPEDEPHAHTIYSVSKLREDALPVFPELASCRQEDPLVPVEKPTFVLHPRFGFQSALPIRAIFLPRVTGRPETMIVPGDKTRAIQVLADGTISQIPGTFQSARRLLESFVLKVPCHDLLLGTDRDGVVNAVRGFLQAIRTSS